jgi:hypothetical protein
MKRGFTGPSWCHLCCNEEETQNHLLNLCPYSSQLWDQCANIMRTSDRNRSGIRETIEGWRDSIFHSPILNRIWQLLPGFILWQIWKERNRRIFNSSSLNWQEVWSKILSNIKETINLHPWMDQDLTCPPTEQIILNAWQLCLTPSLSAPIPGSTTKISPSHWEAPQDGYHKINFDGASKGNPGTCRFWGRHSQ